MLIFVSITVFLVAGLVKGVVGFGLPTIGLGLMTLAVGLEQAMTLILWPALITNIWQATFGGQLFGLLHRLWPFLLAATGTVGAGTLVMTALPTGAADICLGALMIAYAVPQLARTPIRLRPGLVTPVGVAAGLLNGVFAGLTGSYTVPGVLYLQALGLPRDALVQAMGLLFLLSTIALAAALAAVGHLDVQAGTRSAMLVLPALAGVYLGQRIRQRISEAVFRKLVLAALVALGAYLLPLGIWRLFG